MSIEENFSVLMQQVKNGVRSIDNYYLSDANVYQICCKTQHKQYNI